MAQKKLKEWVVCIHPNGAFTAPECRGNPSVGGMLDGHRIVTSPIVAFEGRHVQTLNSVYRLSGKPDAFFLKFLEEKGLPYSSRNPLYPLKKGGYIR